MDTLTDKIATSKQPQPFLFAVDRQADLETNLKVARATNPLPEATLGDLGVGARVTGPDEFPRRMLILPFDADRLTGLDGPNYSTGEYSGLHGRIRTGWSLAQPCRQRVCGIGREAHTANKRNSA
jgi:hypothetical protein